MRETKVKVYIIYVYEFYIIKAFNNIIKYYKIFQSVCQRRQMNSYRSKRLTHFGTRRRKYLETKHRN